MVSFSNLQLLVHPALWMLGLLVVDLCAGSFVPSTIAPPRIETRRIPGWHHRGVGRPTPSPSPSSLSGSSDDTSAIQATDLSGKTISSSSSSSSSSIPTLPKLIITCATTEELKEAVECYVQSHHVVAEIGSQLREVSTRICERCQRATLVDVRRKFPHVVVRGPSTQDLKGRTDAMRLAPAASAPEGGGFFPDKASFQEMEQLSDWPWTVFGSHPSSQRPPSSPHAYFDVLVLDVNAIVGNDLEWTSLQMIQQFHALNRRAELIVLVKSSGLNQWANRIHHPLYWRQHQDDLWKIMNHIPPFIVATVGVQEYRSTIVDIVRPDDFVLEVGCHCGTTTALLKEKAAHCMGVDVGRKIIAQAKIRYPNIDFRVGDAWKTAELLRFLQDYNDNNKDDDDDADASPSSTTMTTTIPRTRRQGFDVVYIDVGGLSGIDGMLEAIQLLSSIRYALEPRCIVIKSKCMQRLSSKLMSFWMLKRKQRSEEDDEEEEEDGSLSSQDEDDGAAGT